MFCQIISSKQDPEQQEGIKFIWEKIKTDSDSNGFTAEDFVAACRRKGVTDLTDEQIIEVFEVSAIILNNIVKPL